MRAGQPAAEVGVVVHEDLLLHLAAEAVAAAAVGGDDDAQADREPLLVGPVRLAGSTGAPVPAAGERGGDRGQVEGGERARRRRGQPGVVGDDGASVSVAGYGGGCTPAAHSTR